MTDEQIKHEPWDTPLAEVTDRLADEGADGQFQAMTGGLLRCLTCRSEFDASTQRADHVTRLEGASDPADMVIVIPVACPECATSGTFVAHFGAQTTLEESDVLNAIERTPAEGTARRSTPGIV